MAKRGRPSKTAKAESGSAPSDATPGHNSALSDDERQALHWSHVQAYEISLAAFKTAQADLKNTARRIKAEGDSVAKVQITIALRTPEGEAAFKARIQDEMEVAAWNGVGVQTELFGDADLTPASDRAFDAGKRAGMQGEPRKPPHDPSTEQYRRWMDGYTDGNSMMAGKGFKAPADGEPPPGVPREQWHQQLRDQHEAGLNLGDAAPTHEVVQQ
jgi:hypothetical protein